MCQPVARGGIEFPRRWNARLPSLGRWTDGFAVGRPRFRDRLL